MNLSYTFPRKFTWGVSTAAPQIEGGSTAGGKGESIWDRFAKKPGRIQGNGNLDVACDHYHRYKSDFVLMRKLGVKNYRLSIAWPRIYPQGRGAINRKGIDFYHRLIDAMLAQGITPWVTMYHWDLPQALEDTGGWRTRAIADDFGAYADTIVKAYGDRVKNWITLNEIYCFVTLGHDMCSHAPGTKESEQMVNQIYHHALLCHGQGVRAVREHGGKGARVGLTDNVWVMMPLTETKADIAAAKEAFIKRNAKIIEPIFRGRYSADYLRTTGAARPIWKKGDMELISLPTDFIGLNIYFGEYVRAGKGGHAESVTLPSSYPRADSPWLNLTPDSLYWGPRWMKEIYGVKSIYITENGAGYDDAPPVKGELLDVHRRNYARACLKELHRAIQEGIPVHGYFLWSFLDNFEWQDGYNRRFGIVYTDYAKQKRTPKLSALWYSQVMKENRLV